jgi:predicted transcriptional regulator/Zn-dependent protease with chaperone function
MRRFGELEAVIMARLWERARPTLVREMVEDLREDRALAYTTVMTVMDNLYRKGWLRRERDGRAWRYEPTGSRSGYTAALMNDALATSADRRTALAHFALQMSPHDAAVLREALDQALGEPGARWPDRAPLLAILTYLAAGWSVVAALGLAGLTLAVHATALGGGLSHLIGACVLRLRATYGTPGGATVAALGLSLAGAVAARTALTAITHFRAAGQQALRHAQTARLVGHPEPALGAVLVEHAQPHAYCVAGRHPTVILTTGAVQALDHGQLDAVLAHERAHLAGRHHRLLALARIGRLVLPFLPLMRDADEQVARLVELHADDAAARARDPRLLATALVVLATAASPAPALAAAATDSVQRIHRLLGPAEPLGRARRQLLGTIAAALALTPVALALAPAVLALALGRLPAT